MTPTVVLVHGAFADSSSWSEVVSRLQHEGFPVIAVANPLRGLANDSAYLSSVLAGVSGPVVLAGHSYGGMVITEAAATNPQVEALVYIAAFAPETGESALSLSGEFPGSKLGPDTTDSVPYPDGIDTYIKPDSFREVFAGDLPESTTSVLAATQRPAAVAALTDNAAGPSAWQTIPSWYLVADEDNAIPPAAQRFMAERAKSHVTDVNASHAVAVSRPDVVAEVIARAARGDR